MFNLNPFAWVAIAFALLGAVGGGLKWIRADAAADAVAEWKVVADTETTKLQNQEAVRAADNAAQTEREALVAETEAAERERQVEELNARIAELEGKNAKCGFVSRDTVRAINSSR